MSNPAKAITAGVLVFALGGVLLSAQPFDQRGGSVLAAATDGAGPEPATVTGTFEDFGTSDEVDGELTDGYLRSQSDWTGRLEMSDPRLTGDWSGTAGVDRYYLPDATDRFASLAETYSGTVTVENDGGRWVGTLLGCSGCNETETWVVELVGTEGYEGLSALLFTTEEPVFYGVIVPGDLAPGQ